MRYFLSVLATLAWALWLGGILALFLFITKLFDGLKTDHLPVFDSVAPTIFLTFERYQLVVGGLALVSAFGLRIVAPVKMLTALFIVLALSAAIGLCEPLFITPRIAVLLERGQQDSAEFKKLHGVSMMLYCAEAAALLVAGGLLPAALRARRDGVTTNA